MYAFVKMGVLIYYRHWYSSNSIQRLFYWYTAKLAFTHSNFAAY